MSVVVAAGALLLPGRAWAQDGAPVDATAATPRVVQPPARRYPRRLYFGMWTTHLKNDVVVLNNNWVVGLSAGGYFGATFLNSFGRRAFTGGLERPIVTVQRGAFEVAVGYRAGFVTGYDGRLMRVARKTPVLPLVQPFASLDIHRRVGIEVSYTFVVASTVISYRF